MTNFKLGRQAEISTFRENSNEPWGFRLSGGKDQGQPLSISQVRTTRVIQTEYINVPTQVVKDSLVQRSGVLAKDLVISVAGIDIANLGHAAVNTKNSLNTK